MPNVNLPPPPPLDSARANDWMIQLHRQVTGGVGYAAGQGGAVVQATNKATGVTLSKLTGQITLNAANLNANTAVSFVLTNTLLLAGDFVAVNHVSGGTPGAYNFASATVAGSSTITVRNVTAGNLAEAIVIQFVVIRAVTA